MTTSVFMVGTEASLKSNSWQAMCADKEAADKFVAENPAFPVIKEVTVRPPRRARK